MKEKLKVTSLVAQELNLNETTLRKYAKLLEDFNYPISRNSQGQRLYSEENIEKLKEFQELINDKGFTLIKAAELVTVEYRQDNLEVVVERLNDRVATLEKVIATIENKVEN
ncbi:MerR family transcriptional regulator [Lysinibacillus xylanilyticus]|uniref:helix-turn-helix domain-containing protein n=1 Tax=Lysinibacillus xylanilyticus TaxID=582475 RepID=UPI003D98FEBC